MSIRTTKPSALNEGVVAKAMRGLVGVGKVPDLTGLELAAPHQVFTLGLPGVTKADLQSAKERGWRYIVLRDNVPFAMAEVTQAGETGQVRMSHFSFGPEVRASVQALHAIESLDELAEREFELRLLCIPPLNVNAFWLVSDGDNTLMPISASHGLTAFQPCRVPDFFKSIARAAERRLKNRHSGGVGM